MRKGLLIAMMFASYLTFSQDVKFTKENFPQSKIGLKTAIENLNSGKRKMDLGENYYKDALPFFEKAYEFNPDNASLNFNMGLCYLTSLDRSKALPFLQKAKSLDSNVSVQLDYNLGLAHHLNMDFERAISLFKNYSVKARKTCDASFLNESFDQNIQMRIAQSENAIELTKNPLKVRIENMGEDINSEHNEYAPYLSADENVMFHTSRRPETDSDMKDPNINEFYEDIYVSYKDDKGNWSESKKMENSFNTKFHNATGGMSADGNKLIIYSGQIDGGDLFESSREGDGWSKPKPFGKNINTKYHESSACYSADGNTLYFVSDRKGGLGGRDIYFSKKDTNGVWGEAKVLGDNINTSFNEGSVFMHPTEKTLYFSSEGHSSIGGYDIFKSVYNDSTQSWGPAENIGYPINTVDDDIYYIPSASGKHAYFTSSVGDVMGGSDLFKVSFTDEKSMELDHDDVIVATDLYPAVEIAQLEDITYVLGKVTDHESHEGLAAHLEILNVVNNQVYKAVESDDGSGELYFELPPQGEYRVMTTKVGYFYSITKLEIPPNTSEDQKLEIELNKVVVGAHMTLENVFFDSGKSTLRPESFTELDQLVEMMKLMPTLKVEIAGHTDSQGAAASNLALSQRRAMVVREYLNSHGVDLNNVVSQGYGETQLVNGCKDGVRCSKEQHQANRRTEFIVIGV